MCIEDISLDRGVLGGVFGGPYRVHTGYIQGIYIYIFEFLEFSIFRCFIKSFKIIFYMTVMEDLLLQKGCLKSDATLFELILCVFMYFGCLSNNRMLV